METQTRQEQFELFKGNVDDSRNRSFSRINSFINFNLNWENVILLAIFCLMLVILSFSLGVEKGEKNPVNQGPIAASQVKSVSTPKPATIDKKPVLINAPTPQTKAVSVPERRLRDGDIIVKRYTVQIASLENLASVHREVERLKKSGYEIWVKQSGKYYILCVGKFSSSDEAKNYQKNLRKMYDDCFIRRL